MMQRVKACFGEAAAPPFLEFVDCVFSRIQRSETNMYCQGCFAKGTCPVHVHEERMLPHVARRAVRLRMEVVPSLWQCAAGLCCNGGLRVVSETNTYCSILKLL